MCAYRSESLSLRADRSAEVVGRHTTPDASNYISVSAGGGHRALPSGKNRPAANEAGSGGSGSGVDGTERRSFQQSAHGFFSHAEKLRSSKSSRLAVTLRVCDFSGSY